MANHWKLEEYDAQEEWSQYIERLEFYFEADGVDNADQQRAILLSVCGSKTSGNTASRRESKGHHPSTSP